MTRSTRFRVSVLLLALLFAAPAAFASGKGRAQKENARGFFAPLWEAVLALLPQSVKSHGGMDPDGASAPPPSSGAESDSHGGMDPDGRT